MIGNVSPATAEREPVKLTLTSLDDLNTRVDDARAAHDRHFPGDSTDRQPVHTLYVPADRFTAGTATDMGAEALRLLDAHAPTAVSMSDAFGIDAALAESVRERVAAKLAREPVEDLRIDFEDGYGVRPDDEEDGHVTQAVAAVAAAYEARRLPYYWGLRVKSFADGGHQRSMRTLDGFLTGLATRLGKLPGGFVVTFPKIISAEHVAIFAEFLSRFEAEIGLPGGQLRFEIQVETTESIIDERGQVGLRAIVEAAAGRLHGAHFGVYDYTAACGLPPAEQRLDHAACDFARHVMQVTLAGTGVRLSDGSTNIVPASDSPMDVHGAWRAHTELVRHSLRHGFPQGWDLHAAQLASRYAAVYDFYLTGMDETLARLRAWQDGVTGTAGVLDEPATIKALTARLRRAADCGAVDADTVKGLL
jgi:citrate lyase beta subunit